MLLQAEGQSCERNGWTRRWVCCFGLFTLQTDASDSLHICCDHAAITAAVEHSYKWPDKSNAAMASRS